MLTSRILHLTAWTLAVNLLAVGWVTCCPSPPRICDLAESIFAMPESSSDSVPADESSPGSPMSEDAPDAPFYELISALTRSLDIVFLEHGSHHPASLVLMYSLQHSNELLRPPCV